MITPALPDITNGLFEFGTGLAACHSCRRLYKDKTVAGFSTYIMWWVTLWGFYNLYFYPHLNQWWSFTGGLLVVSANTTWIAMMLYYKHLYRGGNSRPADFRVDRSGAVLKRDRLVVLRGGKR